MLRDNSLILDITDAAKAATSYVQGMDKEDFLTDRRTQKAVIYEIQTIGEAVKKLSKEFCHHNPNIPWAKMAGMRDKLVHDYHHVDLDRVWSVATKNLPELIQKIEPLLKRIIEENPE